MDILDIVAQQQAFTSAMTQQAFSIGIQKQALEAEASMVGKLMESASVGTQQISLPEVNLRMDALGERGIGTRLSVAT